MKKEKLKYELLSVQKWLRILFMLLFAAIMYFILAIVCFIGLFQFIAHLITGKSNQNLREFGEKLSCYVASIIKFISYYSETKPFPFSAWLEKKETPKQIEEMVSIDEPEHKKQPGTEPNQHETDR